MRRVFYSILYTLQVLIKTKNFWSWPMWLKFWIISNTEKQIKLGKHFFTVRGQPFFSKLTDMYVILENVYDKSYEFDLDDNKNGLIVDIGAYRRIQRCSGAQKKQSKNICIRTLP
ncbi:hypothetical protein A2Z63_01110 [Candidatus Giovannonibacteria bacterium RIFCSPLOWO2_02_44_8]|uniref:Uncharacterized protein n=2 Tax=Candidatus Giovannoniibacteriota TaxID=1752738 RepID=A0A1F5XDS5_9BACT|nr:MAG: hypothetical protein A2Z63_01110 [Candidatus Giovannonibacteria bacterium RIFCSPLOWO2_02_44_8]OGF95034.1 MAG: hypothetical protein A2Y47_00600 [Candidatus Giovannonibacteria bacterium RIFCSPLOWO2_12_43_8]